MSEVKTGGLICSGQSMASNFTSDPVNISNAPNVAVQCHSAATGSRVGVLYFEVSNDGTNYTTLASKAVSTLTLLDHVEDLVTAAKFLQVRYEATSGTGTVDVIVSKKKN